MCCFALLSSALLSWLLSCCCSQERRERKLHVFLFCFISNYNQNNETEKEKLDAFPQTHTQTPDASIILVTFIIEVYNQCTDPSSQAQTFNNISSRLEECTSGFGSTIFLYIYIYNSKTRQYSTCIITFRMHVSYNK